MKVVEHQRIPTSVVKELVEENDETQRQGLLNDLTTLLSALPIEKRVLPFLLRYPEVSKRKEKYKEFAVITLVEQLKYWQYYRSQLQSVSLADYLDIGNVLPIVNRGSEFYVTVVKEEKKSDFPEGRSYVRTVSLAGDGDFWSSLSESKIKVTVLLDSEYGTNHLPMIPLQEIGIQLENVQKLLQSRETYFQTIIALFEKNIRLQVLDKHLPPTVLGANSNPLSIISALYKHYGTLDETEKKYNEFTERFNEYVSEQEWQVIWESLDSIISEFQTLVKIAYAHT